MITRGARRQNKARREFLREPRDGLIVFGNACNNVANAKKFFVGLATVLQTPKSFSRGICSVPARALFPILAFAELLQGPFSPFWRLQNFCKRAFSHFGVCRTSARALFSILAFAELLQARFSPFWRLQKSCKDQKVSRGICSVAASISKSSALPLGLYQRHSSGIRILILSPNSRLECVSYRFFA